MKEGVSYMATQEKNQLGDGSDNYAGAAKQAANAAKSAKEAGKTAAKETAKKGAEATSRAAAATVKASVEGGKAAAQIAPVLRQADLSEQPFRLRGLCGTPSLRF